MSRTRGISVRLMFTSGPIPGRGSLRLSCSQDAELLQRGCSIVQPDLLGDLTILHTKHGGSRESHFSAGGRRKRADDKVAESGAGMRAASFPAADDIIAFGDEIRHAPELEVRECSAEFGHEFLHVLATAPRRMQRILQENVRRAELVDNAGVPGIAPKLREPSRDDGFVFLFLRHRELLLSLLCCLCLLPPLRWR